MQPISCGNFGIARIVRSAPIVAILVSAGYCQLADIAAVLLLWEKRVTGSNPFSPPIFSTKTALSKGDSVARYGQFGSHKQTVSDDQVRLPSMPFGQVLATF